MNAINHAATALLLKKRWPDLPLLPALISVQLIEFLWVFLNLANVEVTTTEPDVRALNDIHLLYMPYSHSVGSVLLIAALCWFVLAKVMRRPGWAIPVAVGICSHVVLDVLVHARDIEIIPGLMPLKIGSGLYDLPALALVVETVYGVFCWWVFRGSARLLAAIVVLNLATLSFYVPQIPGPEMLLAGHPKIFAAIILVHIVFGQWAIWLFARRTNGLDASGKRTITSGSSRWFAWLN
ncbi:MAG: hypothetical protein ACXWC4_09165 [Telluria sp.]